MTCSTLTARHRRLTARAGLGSGTFRPRTSRLSRFVALFDPIAGFGKTSGGGGQSVLRRVQLFVSHSQMARVPLFRPSTGSGLSWSDCATFTLAQRKGMGRFMAAAATRRRPSTRMSQQPQISLQNSSRQRLRPSGRFRLRKNDSVSSSGHKHRRNPI